ncbi:Sec-independent protein translocase protein TatB [Rhodococcoides corynebacterioides]|uniref:Sec-independent protein translocase protein TatB n=1 Tax=Rhodococcoides corynebacterioides TaxID=53972 RepID=UPI001C9A60F4|nr:Sec-independent protein translocase protein TatB [Rhodococcus corynebacterioides]MBY6365005.1 Sec-independent protein translocase subunit TatB [Rhodococcus corynebacterioides]
MFANIGWGEMLVLLIAALVVLGPERLPGAVTWVTKLLRQVRDYASGASAQLKNELGTDFDDLRKPLADLNQLRKMTPRAVVTKHLLDGDDSIFTGNFDKPGGGTAATGSQSASLSSRPSLSKDPARDSLAGNERPPIDPDAT